MTEKRKPTLADVFIAHQYTTNDPFRFNVNLRIIGELQQKVRKANKFIFDSQASQRMGEVVRDIPDLIIKESRFARAPFDLTWVEFNSSVFWYELYRDRPEFNSNADPEHARAIGMLIDGDSAILVAGHSKAETSRGRPNSDSDVIAAYVCPLGYQLNTEPNVYDMADKVYPTGMDSQTRFVDRMNHLFWGQTAVAVSEEIVTEASRHFLAKPIMDGFYKLQPANVRKILDMCAGDLRDVVTCLLLLNRPAITHYVNDMPKSRGWLRNRMIPYWAHTTVTISIDPKPILKLIGTPGETGITKRRHEVEGHYCHNKTAHEYEDVCGCVHDWIDTDADWIPLAMPYAKSDVNHWVCKICEGKRWWRNEHWRGDATKGFVIRDRYNVTT